MKRCRFDILDADPRIKLERAIGCDGSSCGLTAASLTSEGVRWHGAHWHIVIESVNDGLARAWVLGVRVPLTVR
jgi:hypothetical protein